MTASNILVIIQRSNGDVFLSASLIQQLQQSFQPDAIDLLVNDDTLPIAQTLSFIRQIHTFSYRKKKENKWKQEKEIIKKIYRKYDLSINLTASDRSVIYALIASRKAVSAVEENNIKSWWKKILLKFYYNFEVEKHILLNNLKPLQLLGIEVSKKQPLPKYSDSSAISIKNRLNELKINEFLIFHPSAQYEYKIYSQKVRDKLLGLLNQLDVPIITTGGLNEIDKKIKESLPKLDNVIDFIGETTIEEYIALSELSQGYIGMDTLNMHIAAAQNKRIFAIFGPTNLNMWSPWSNKLELSAKENKPLQTYGNVTVFQAEMPCIACGKKGCNNNGVISECLNNISPIVIFKEIEEWFLNKAL
jgi:heptosyltransferase-3